MINNDLPYFEICKYERDETIEFVLTFRSHASISQFALTVEDTKKLNKILTKSLSEIKENQKL